MFDESKILCTIKLALYDVCAADHISFEIRPRNSKLALVDPAFRALPRTWVGVREMAAKGSYRLTCRNRDPLFCVPPRWRTVVAIRRSRL